jgi:dTDP-4-dehydrorhamnose reductase
MRKISILQFGRTGQVAHELLRAASSRADISIHGLSRQDADFRFPERVAAAVRSAGSIDAIVNAVAYTAVDKAESETELARTVNAISVAELANAAASRAIPLLHLSTDYVFDGAKPSPYIESDEPSPLNVYGRTKLEGEEAVRASGGSHVVLRTSWVYASHGTNFVTTMLRLGRERDELRVVDDQHGGPTSAPDVAAAILAMVRHFVSVARPEHFGTFHFSGEGDTTWRRFGEATFEEAGPRAGLRARITPIATSDYPTAARRPLNSRLDCSKIESVYGIKPPPWRQSLGHIVRELESVRERGKT